MMYGWGDWLAWSRWVEPTVNPFEGAIMANETVQGLAKRWAKYEERGRGSLAPEPVGFLAWTFDELREKQALTLKHSMPPRLFCRPFRVTKGDARLVSFLLRAQHLPYGYYRIFHLPMVCKVVGIVADKQLPFHLAEHALEILKATIWPPSL